MICDAVMVMWRHCKGCAGHDDREWNRRWDMPFPGSILGMRSANGRRRYNVTSSLIDWAYTQNDPCLSNFSKVPVFVVGWITVNELERNFLYPIFVLQGALSFEVSENKTAFESISCGGQELGNGVNWQSGLLCEVVLTFALVTSVLNAAVDSDGKNVLAPLAIGFTVFVDILAG